MKKSYLIGIVIIIIVGVGAYFLGVNSGKAQGGASGRSAPFAQFALRGDSAASGTAVFGGRAGAGGGTFGQIVSVSGSSMVIQVGSSTQIVLLTPSTAIQKTVSGSSSDLTAGETVTIAGTSNSDGSLTAHSVEIRPATSRTGVDTSGSGQKMRSAPMMPAQ